MLINKRPLLLNKDLADNIGLNEALVLQQVHYWLGQNKKNNRNFHEGRYWTYNTLEEWQKEFSFWSLNTVKRIFKKLREMELLIVNNFNSYQMDRTLWYSIDYEKLGEFVSNEDNNDAIVSNCIHQENQNESMEETIMAPAIPEISTENSSDMFNKSINQEKENLNIGDKSTERGIDRGDGFIDEYERIIDKCDLYLIEESYRDAVAQAIKILLIEIQNKKRIKIGDNLIPVQLIKNDLEKLNHFVIDHAISKFKEASYEYKIRNTIAYLKSCIVNAINEMRIDIDSELRTCGII